MTRTECIDFLLSSGAKDLTSEKHPNKKGKLYLRLFLKGKSSYVDFNFDYYEYKQVSVFANRRKDIRKHMNFNEVKTMLFELGFGKIYIAGQITGLPIEKARQNFAEAEFKLNLKGYNTVNPMALERYHPDKEWIDYMIESLELLRKCDGIYLMDNYILSRGAQIERLAAISMNKNIITL